MIPHHRDAGAKKIDFLRWCWLVSRVPHAVILLRSACASRKMLTVRLVLIIDRLLSQYLSACESYSMKQTVLAYLVAGDSLPESFDKPHNLSRIPPPCPRTEPACFLLATPVIAFQSLSICCKDDWQGRAGRVIGQRTRLTPCVAVSPQSPSIVVVILAFLNLSS